LPILLAQIAPLAIFVAVIGCIALLGFLLVKGFWQLARKIWGFSTVAQEFPPPQIDKTGESFRAGGYVSGRIRCTFRGLLQPFTVEPAQQGLLITASFDSDAPIFIPWTAIREASYCGGSVLVVTIEHARTLQFYLPPAAVPIVQANIPADRFHQESFGDLLRSRLGG
jgi:hypothetical protein